MKKGFSNRLGQSDIDRLEAELYKFADIKEFATKTKSDEGSERQLLKEKV